MAGADIQIGLALSAGGASAMAEIGVVEELVNAGIPIHCVAGTSAGAMVGAAFAADRLAGFRDTMTSLTRRRVLRIFDPTWPRTGLLGGRRAMKLISPYVGSRIEDLERRFAAVATDLVTGEEVVLRTGEVLSAIRASIAIPGIFTPVRRQRRLLVDGGLVDPIPVGTARSLGADVVIAVSVLPLPPGDASPSRRRLTAELFRRVLSDLRPIPETHAGAEEDAEPQDAGEATLGLIEIVVHATRIAAQRIAASRLRDEPPEALVLVDVPQIGILDFHRSGEMVEIGRAAARRALPEIRATLAAASSFRRRLTRWGRTRVKAEKSSPH
jgi:NTE family protein